MFISSWRTTHCDRLRKIVWSKFKDSNFRWFTIRSAFQTTRVWLCMRTIKSTCPQHSTAGELIIIKNGTSNSWNNSKLNSATTNFNKNWVSNTRFNNWLILVIWPNVPQVKVDFKVVIYVNLLFLDAYCPPEFPIFVDPQHLKPDAFMPKSRDKKVKSESEECFYATVGYGFADPNISLNCALGQAITQTQLWHFSCTKTQSRRPVRKKFDEFSGFLQLACDPTD